MPFINGRFYANPAYGQAVERARDAEASQSKPQGNQKNAPPPQASGKATGNGAEGTSKRGNIVYNETGGLRPKAGAKPGEPGSAEDLHNARVAMSNVIENRASHGIKHGVAPDKVVAAGQRTPQFKDAQAAAAEAARSPDATKGSQNFYLDYGEPQPPFAKGKKTISYGPFKNVAGGGDVTKGADTSIVIVYPKERR